MKDTWMISFILLNNIKKKEVNGMKKKVMRAIRFILIQVLLAIPFGALMLFGIWLACWVTSLPLIESMICLIGGSAVIVLVYWLVQERNESRKRKVRIRQRIQRIRQMRHDTYAREFRDIEIDDEKK